MGKGPKSRCQSASHKLLKDKAKSRVDDLQGVFMDLQSARKESRSVDVVVLEEQVHQMLREWKAELDAQSPASSLQVGIKTSHFIDWVFFFYFLMMNWGSLDVYTIEFDCDFIVLGKKSLSFLFYCY